MITGAWKGRINKQKVEIKIIQNGDSLTGTSYYYESPNNYRRYTIKGYFDATTNAAVWWDDQLVDERSGRFNISVPGKVPQLSHADFNCPGGGKMMLDGKAADRDHDEYTRGDIHLDKVDDPTFQDEWDYVINNYTTGTNDPDIIDSVSRVRESSPLIEEPVISKPEPPKVVAPKKPDVQVIEKRSTSVEPIHRADEQPPQTIEQKLVTRKKIFTKEIPLEGDSIELRFYDNAEIDGDSISLFLNDQLIFQHMRLLGTAQIIKLSVKELKDTNELIMVAENLGSIPPNTAYMVALVGDKRYDARLASDEGSSAVIRLRKKL
jgi:hypothetical protein